MDWSTYYNIMSMDNYGYPMINYSMPGMGYQDPYQNLNMPIWNYQNPYYWGGNNQIQSNVSFKGNTQSETTSETTKQPETVKNESKDYISILNDGTLIKSSVYEGAPEKIAAYRQEYKRQERNRTIGKIALVLGGTALGIIAGPKIAKALKLKPDTWFGDMASNDKFLRYMISGTNGMVSGAIGALILDNCNGWKKDLKNKYNLKPLDMAA